MGLTMLVLVRLHGNAVESKAKKSLCAVISKLVNVVLFCSQQCSVLFAAPYPRGVSLHE